MTAPMAEEVIRYCVQDVLYLPMLWVLYDARIDEDYTRSAAWEWRWRIREATEARVKLSQSEGYDPKGKDKVKGPWGADWKGCDSTNDFDKSGKSCILYTKPHHRAYVMW